jgi:hypothetical protein
MLSLRAALCGLNIGGGNYLQVLQSGWRLVVPVFQSGWSLVVPVSILN